MVDNLKGTPVDYTQGGTTQPVTPPSSGNNTIVGFWGYSGIGVFAAIEKYTETEYIELRSDGTLTYVNNTLGTTWNGFTNQHLTSNTSGLTVTANYSIQGNFINCTNMKYRWYRMLNATTTEYTDEVKPDTALPFKFTDGGSRSNDALTFLEINLWPNESGVMNRYTRFIKPIDLKTISGVVNLPSAIPNNIAPIGINCIFTSATGDTDYIGATSYSAYFSCDSKAHMISMLTPTFDKLVAFGFVDESGNPDILLVEGLVNGKTIRVMCYFSAAVSFNDVEHGRISYVIFN